MDYVKKIWSQKTKILLFVIGVVAFTILMFPFGDLSDKLSSVIAENSDNAIYVQFDDMGLAMIPQPALKMTNVVAETSFASDINIEELYVAPSLLAPLKKKPLGRATANGLFGGSLGCRHRVLSASRVRASSRSCSAFASASRSREISASRLARFGLPASCIVGTPHPEARPRGTAHVPSRTSVSEKDLSGS